jgi:hypothetical protein
MWFRCIGFVCAGGLEGRQQTGGGALLAVGEAGELFTAAEGGIEIGFVWSRGEKGVFVPAGAAELEEGEGVLVEQLGLFGRGGGEGGEEGFEKVFELGSFSRIGGEEGFGGGLELVFGGIGGGAAFAGGGARAGGAEGIATVGGDLGGGGHGCLFPFICELKCKAPAAGPGRFASDHHSRRFKRFRVLAVKMLQINEIELQNFWNVFHVALHVPIGRGKL